MTLTILRLQAVCRLQISPSVGLHVQEFARTSNVVGLCVCVCVCVCVCEGACVLMRLFVSSVARLCVQEIMHAGFGRGCKS